LLFFLIVPPGNRLLSVGYSPERHRARKPDGSKPHLVVDILLSGKPIATQRPYAAQ